MYNVHGKWSINLNKFFWAIIYLSKSVADKD